MHFKDLRAISCAILLTCYMNFTAFTVFDRFMYTCYTQFDFELINCFAVMTSALSYV